MHFVDLVSGDQDGFVLKHGFAENYAYAMDIIRCCSSHNISMVVLKFDFHKAFDSVN